MENKKRIREVVKKILKEGLLHEQDAEITINKSEKDYRSKKTGQKARESSYDVNYQITIDGKLFEIEGLLIPYSTGRAVEYTFEPFYFDTPETEQYYDDNWENIEEQILEEFYA